MTKAIIIRSCAECPNYKTENNVYRFGTVGEVARCGVMAKEIDFTDKSDIPETYSKVHEDCPLDDFN